MRWAIPVAYIGPARRDLHLVGRQLQCQTNTHMFVGADLNQRMRSLIQLKHYQYSARICCSNCVTPSSNLERSRACHCLAELAASPLISLGCVYTVFVSRLHPEKFAQLILRSVATRHRRLEGTACRGDQAFPRLNPNGHSCCCK